MKKLFLSLIVLSTLFLSCTQSVAAKVTINNTISEDVTFYINDTEITLAPSESYSFDYYSFCVSFKNKDQRLMCLCKKINNTEQIFDITYLTPTSYSVYNPTSKTILLSENNNGIGKPAVKSVTITPDTTVNIDVYLSNPDFTAVYENGAAVDITLISITKN